MPPSAMVGDVFYNYSCESVACIPVCVCACMRMCVYVCACVYV